VQARANLGRRLNYYECCKSATVPEVATFKARFAASPRAASVVSSPAADRRSGSSSKQNMGKSLSAAVTDDKAGVLLLDGPGWARRASPRVDTASARQAPPLPLVSNPCVGFHICTELSETVPTAGSKRKSRDYLRPRSGRILQPCGIGSPSTRLR
jgi:hypothetical protein